MSKQSAKLTLGALLCLLAVVSIGTALDYAFGGEVGIRFTGGATGVLIGLGCFFWYVSGGYRKLDRYR